MTLKRIIRIVFISLLLTGIAGFAMIIGINIYVQESVKDLIITGEEALDIKDFDCILVLGAGVWGDRPSPMLEDRLLKSIDLYKNGVSDRLLMSGDHGRKEYDEVNVMKQFAIDAGIPSEHIFMDHAGFSTYESLYRTRDIFQGEKIIIVTQRYHLYRALYIAKRLRIEAYGVDVDLRNYPGQDYREMREKLARVKDFFYVIFMPQPTYLGEQIPVSGNGDITNDKTNN